MKGVCFPRRVSWVLAAVLTLSVSARAEDLLQVYAQARASDPVLAGAAAQRGQQQELSTQARAALLPQWSLDYSDSRAQQDGGRTQDLNSRVSQVLIDLGKLRSWDAAEAQLSAQDARVRAAEQQLCARVASVYFGVLSAEASLATAIANEDAFAQQVAQAQSRFEAGLSAQLDVDQARAYRELARGGTLQAREALADAREALAQLTGQMPGKLKPLTALLQAQPPAPQDAQAWVEQALQGNPTLQAYALQLRASEQRIAAAGAAHLPTLSLGLDSERRSGSAVAPADAGRMVSTVALRLNIPLFAGGATESQKRQAVYQRDAAREDMEVSRRALVRETQAQYQAVQTSLLQIASGQAAVKAADQMLAATRAGQTLGTRSMTDLLLAIQTQSNAQNALQQARHRYVLATLLLQQAAGRLGEAELAQVNQLLMENT
ncbi:TolC family outer membrane protein [Paucibacter sp. APW11]|uniref:TolC family outer membrane protein n=1 Tax=Roseateles aquae TaxID=3077235 RepID=A0ABU3PIH4_9BURK|nr:TolC family outer membrane protein [Paucibacter sp. APW11]MDT9001816.1 TolC family outer membrane protein [Paucibacter sp. APW11]